MISLLSKVGGLGLQVDSKPWSSDREISLPEPGLSEPPARTESGDGDLSGKVFKFQG